MSLILFAAPRLDYPCETKRRDCFDKYCVDDSGRIRPSASYCSGRGERNGLVLFSSEYRLICYPIVFVIISGIPRQHSWVICITAHVRSAFISCHTLSSKSVPFSPYSSKEFQNTNPVDHHKVVNSNQNEASPHAIRRVYLHRHEARALEARSKNLLLFHLQVIC